VRLPEEKIENTLKAIVAVENKDKIYLLEM
jgi:hypothetical protein